MKPREKRETGQNDLFKARLDQIIDMSHPLVKLAATIDWGFLEQSFGAVYNDGPGQPPLPTRLMVGLAILKRMHDLSDEVLCERFVENPYYLAGQSGDAINAVLAAAGYNFRRLLAWFALLFAAIWIALTQVSETELPYETA